MAVAENCWVKPTGTTGEEAGETTMLVGRLLNRDADAAGDGIIVRIGDGRREVVAAGLRENRGDILGGVGSVGGAGISHPDGPV